MAEITENSLGVPSGSNTASDPTERLKSEFASIQQDLGESYDTPTVFVSIPKELDPSSSPGCYAWPGPSLPETSEGSFQAYQADCAREASSVITDENLYRACHNRAKRNPRPFNNDSILKDVQNKLDHISHTAQNFRAIAVDDKTFSDDWEKLHNSSSSNNVKGLDNSSSDNLTLGVIALSVTNRPIRKHTKRSSCTSLLSTLMQSKEPSPSENIVTGFSIYPKPKGSQSREDVRTHLHYIASRLMDKCQSHAPPSEETITELLGKYPGCEVVQISEGSTNLPILEKVKYIKESDTWPPTKDVLRTEENAIGDKKAFELECSSRFGL